MKTHRMHTKGSIEHTAQAIGRECEVVLAQVDNVLSGEGFPADMNHIFMEIGTAGEPREAAIDGARRAAQALVLIAASPNARGLPISITLGGYESDPRELPDIPEAMDVIKAFSERLRDIEEGSGDVRVLNRMDSFSRALVRLSLGLITRDLIHFDAPTKDVIAEQFAEDIARAALVDDVIDAMVQRAAKRGPKS